MTDEKKIFLCPVDEEGCEVIDAVTDLQLRTAALEQQVKTDGLTGLTNFRGFEEKLEQEMERTRRLEHPTSLLMIDIDHFKKVNDTHGHEVGNQALVHVTELLCRTLRKLDIPCRYGGEEFALILPTTRMEHAVLVAERIRKLVEANPLDTEGTSIPLSISIGVDTYLPVDNRPGADLIKSADAYLYQAKHSGRNCTCHPPIDRSVEQSAVGSKERQELFAAFGRKKD